MADSEVINLDEFEGLDNLSILYTLLTSENKINKLKDLLIRLINIFDKINIKWWADGGTLLGLIRNEGIIPWDDDVDIGMLLSEEYIIYDNINLFNINGLRIRRNRTNAYWQIDLMTNNNKLNEIHIDLFLYENIDNILYNTDKRFTMPNINSGHCNISYPYNNLFPLIKKKFYDFELNCPIKYDSILCNSLGNDYLKIGLIKKNIDGNQKVYKIKLNT